MEAMKDIIELLANAVEEESANKCAPLVEALSAKYNNLRDIESFHSIVTFQAQQVLNQTMYAIFPESKDRSVREAYEFWDDIYRFAGHLVESIRRDQGDQWPSLCSMDVGRFIANNFIQYCKTNELPVFERTAETYWVPEFGTAEEWMAFCKGVVYLRYHRPEKYMEAMAVMDKYRKMDPAR